MSRICQVTGKKPISGNNVSHSKRKTRRRFLPNLNNKKYYIPETDQWVQLKISASAMRTVNKVGIYEFLKKQQKAGFDIGIDLK